MSEQTSIIPTQPTARFEQISPEEAAAMLELNVHNRALKRQVVRRYVEMMSDGNWLVTGQPIIFGASGELLDGQHRLMAIVESGATVTSLVVRNVADSDSVMSVIDTGAVRNPGDVFRVRGILNANMAAATTRMVIAYENRTVAIIGDRVPTRLALLARYDESPDLFQEACRRVNNSRAMPPKLSQMAMACFYVVTVDDSRAGVFFEEVMTGVDIHASSPAYVLRAWADAQERNKERRDKVTDLSAILRAWSAYSVGAKISRIQPWKPNAGMEFNYLKQRQAA